MSSYLNDSAFFSKTSQRAFALGTSHFDNENIKRANEFDSFSRMCWNKSIEKLEKAFRNGEFKALTENELRAVINEAK
jgi:hypothetical protein